MDIGFIRPRKGLPASEQRARLENFGCTHIWTAGNNCDSLAEVIASMREGDRLVVAHIKLLREPRERLDKLTAVTEDMITLGASVYDLETDTEYSGEAGMLRMALAVHATPKGPNNGELGRPKLKYSQDHLDAAKAIWTDIKTYRYNKDSVYAMNSKKNAKETGADCVKPWTVRRALARFKASGRLTPKEQS